ncbi:MAG: hypothetical protein MUF21_00270 [Gemmatimonadaceae bacterium]|jgi:hypothetical protein|nr:hypothetical protein [Gemmatimonadaceae bacterium]
MAHSSVPAGTTPFVNQLRTPGAPLVLAGEGEATIAFRVQFLDAWDAIAVVASPRESVATVKARALAVLAPDVQYPDDVLVKLRGHEVRDERRALADAGVLDGSTLLLHFRKRRPLK